MSPVWELIALTLAASEAREERRPRELVLVRVAARGEGPESLAPLVERVRPTVVLVTTSAKRGLLQGVLSGLFGAGPFGVFAGGKSALGSGVIIDPSGLVLTNNHVIEGADEITVRTADERELKAAVVGSDRETDIALLRLEGVEKPLPAAQLGRSSALRVGDFVVAIGNPFGLDLTVTYGIISAKARELGTSPFDSYLQTDAAINPGSSGGPLFDLEGKVVGINTAIVDNAEGIGFAVPSDLIRTLLPQLQTRGRVVRGFIGASVSDLDRDRLSEIGAGYEHGALVGKVARKGPAALAGLKRGDVVVGFDGQTVEDADWLMRSIARLPPGRHVVLLCVRKGALREVEVTLGERPAD